jgi:alkylation response protein AidB-like acyl-CoA dehydrogenase
LKARLANRAFKIALSEIDINSFQEAGVMAKNQLVDSRDVRFVLYEMLGVDKLNEKFEKYADYDKDIYDSTIELAETIAVDKFYPSNAESDKEGVIFDPSTNEVKVPQSTKDAVNALCEAGFITLSFDQDHGGMGMPGAVSTACLEYFNAGNTAAYMYAGVMSGAAHLIHTYGTEEQKALYTEKMHEGVWGGSMCLTEPDAGSDVGALKTKAVKQPDGTYRITGQKIFITSGENDIVENIIHPVLARIEGDPAGTKGISIFLVPKYLVNADGSMGERNDVVCSGVEHKMGIKASATCTLNFGDNGNCVGYLLGKERQGMKIMFQLMYEARVLTGLQSQALASASYMHAVTYAKNRLQGSHVTQMMNPDAPSVAIVEHPDVKRMLLFMKSYVEGMRMLSYYLSHHVDISRYLEGEEKEESVAIYEILLPLLKAGNSDNAWQVTAEAIQVHGGYGFCQDYPVEQYARDCKILSIYEGTNAIQSLDLTMRKLLMNKDQYYYSILQKRIKETIETAKGVVDDKYIDLVVKGLAKVDEIVETFKGQMATGKFMHIFANATVFQQALYHFVLAWMHLWSLTITTPKLKELIGDAKGEDRQKIIDENEEAAYYNGRVLSSQFFIGADFPKFFGRADCILSGESAVIKASTPCFTGALDE